MIEMAEIKALAQRIAREFKPERIILFGSYAHGAATPDSDVDLLVLAEHTGKSWKFAAQIRDQVHPLFPLDLLVRTPAEVQQRLAGGDPFLREITGNGVVLYEARHR